MTKRTICVGDVHGCLDELDELLRLTEYRRGVDRLVLLGDLVDKGPDPVGVVRRAQEVGAEAVLGNHDEKHLRWRRHEDKRRADPSYVNPMRPFDPVRLAEHEALSDSDIAWLASLPLTLRLDETAIDPSIAVHGGFEIKPLDQQRRDRLVRCRYVDASGEMVAITNDVDQPPGTERWASAWREPMHVFYGHHCTRLGHVLVDHFTEEHTIECFGAARRPDNTCRCGSSGRTWLRVGLDAGVAYGGCLAAMITTAEDRSRSWPSYEVISVKAKQTYARPWMGDDA